MADVINLDFDLGAIEAWDGTKGGGEQIPPGAYKGKVVSAQPHVSKEAKAAGSTVANSYAIEVATEVGNVTLYPGIDFSKAANQRKMKTVLRSIGIAEAKLSGVKAISPALFMGRDGKGADCFILVKSVEGVQTEGQYAGKPKLADREFLTPEQYAEWMKANAVGNGAAKPTTAAPAAPGAADPGLASLFGQ
jgi:hypothetical protein